MGVTISECALKNAEDSDVSGNQEAVITAVKAQGFEVVSDPDGKSLLLDLDTPESIRHYETMLPLIQEHLVITERDRWNSKSGNLHVVCDIDPANPLRIEERLLLQACLGSDRKRDFLTLLRVRKGEGNAAVRLFKPPCS